MTQPRDLAFSRLLLRSVLDALHTARPGLHTSAASLAVWRATDRHGRRWMVFEYDGLRRDGYFANAYEARAAGWLAWMQREGIG